jgi:acyl-CoA thioester hydrolase
VLAKGKTIQAFVDRETFRVVNIKRKYPELWEKLENLNNK